MKFIAQKTEDGAVKGKIAFYCRALKVSRQAFYDHLENRDKPWKHADLADKILEIIAEDECNDTYGRRRIYEALKRDFTAKKPLEKCVTDITEIPAKDGKLYVSAIFDCYDLTVLGISMADNMRAELCAQTLENARSSYPELRTAIIHSDRGSQYTSAKYRDVIEKIGIVQSMNSAGGRCHDNARCESMWARMKEELFYLRNRKTENYTVEELKTLIWRYYAALNAAA